jgi:hypothetical protein
MSNPPSNVPTPGSPLAIEVAERGRGYIDCTDFANALATLFQQNHIYSRIVSLTLTGTFLDSHTITEYYDPVESEWSVADPTFGVVYYDNDSQHGQSSEELSQNVLAESWTSIKPQFVTPSGDSYMTSYYLDPITLFLNVVPQGQSVDEIVPNDPRQFLNPAFPNDPGDPIVFMFGSLSDTAQINNPNGKPGSTSITVAPVPPAYWSGAQWLSIGWSISSAPADVQLFTFRRVMY